MYFIVPRRSKRWPTATLLLSTKFVLMKSRSIDLRGTPLRTEKETNKKTIRFLGNLEV